MKYFIFSVMTIITLSIGIGIGYYFGKEQAYLCEHKFYKAVLLEEANIGANSKEFLKGRFYYTGLMVSERHAKDNFEDYGDISSNISVGKGDWVSRDIYEDYMKYAKW